jgi:hypothetical protein|tara:strand:+ start:150 stop:389 length:240 start_codon:yes stop_codon:yes gene_type:complete
MKDIIRMQQLAGIIKEEPESVESTLFKLKQEFMPAFEQYVNLYEIEVLENPKDDEYQKIQEEFAKQLKEVLFTLQRGEF